MTTRYHPILVSFHWLIALMIMVALVMGGSIMAETPNSDPEKLNLLRNHMIAGGLILVLMIIRLIVRLNTAQPPHADIGNALLNKGGVAAHWALYALVFLTSASGIALSIAAGLPDIIFGGSGAPLPADFHEFGPRAAHGLLTKLIWLVVAAHVLAALYHQFIRKDGLFGRMWYGKR